MSQLNTVRSVSVRCILISSCLCRGHPTGLVASGFSTKMLHQFVPSPMRAACAAHPILLGFIAQSSVLCCSLRRPCAPCAVRLRTQSVGCSHVRRTVGPPVQARCSLLHQIARGKAADILGQSQEEHGLGLLQTQA